MRTFSRSLLLLMVSISLLWSFKQIFNHNNIHHSRHPITTTIVKNSLNEWQLYPESLNNFDSDFAESISKPLPQWFLEQEKLRKKQLLEMEEKSKRMLEEFRAKYIISEMEKAATITKLKEAKKQRKNKKAWSIDSMFKSKDSSVQTKERQIQQQSRQEQKIGNTDTTTTTTDINNEEDEELTTREKWEIFLNEEKESTGFFLPGFFDVFPELKFKWPVWAKKNGKALKCETDADCQFPQSCCAHPIIPGDKFCCTGWGKRIMVPAYQTQMIKPDAINN